VERDALKGLIVGVDLDGVCADFLSRMREIAAEWLERNTEDLTPDVSYGLREWGIKNDEQYNSLHRFAVTQRELFKTTPMIPGARKYLRQLSDDGARIRIITHRLYIHFFHKTAVEQTIDWLDTHGIPYWDLLHERERTSWRGRVHRRQSRQRRAIAWQRFVHDLLCQQHEQEYSRA